MALRRSAHPASEPISLEEAKAHLRVDHDADDALILELIEAARQKVEEWTRRALITQSWQLELDQWPAEGFVRLPRPSAIAITFVKYTDAAGVLQTLVSTNYVLDAATEPARLYPAAGMSWPSARTGPRAVQIEYTAGFGDAIDVPQAIKAAIKIVLDFLYARDPAVIKMPDAVSALLGPYLHAFDHAENV